ncbi:hypothetical protein [Ruegeria arenilitoris]|uniref:hypothetical protein n=1 Tax=Ruegeria arenilitoris TaxID=1173585 RepID=UPI00147EE851|nr:hypothetical protein [Ruegeria arenilitoris]
MTDRRLIGIVTALLFLTTSQGARAEITLEQLLVIDEMLSTNDIQALYAYLERNPELLTGEDELSLELRSFHEAASVGDVNLGYATAASAPADSSLSDNTFTTQQH